MGTFLDRLLFLVEHLAGGKHTIFAKKAGIPPGTFQGYLNGRFPKSDHLLRIREKFHVNLDWFYSGVGEPFLSAPGPVPGQVAGQIAGLASQPPAAGDVEKRWDKVKLGDAVDRLQKIYSSGDQVLIRAINANLDAFTRTVDMGDQVKSLNARLDVMETTIQKLEKIIEELSSREECCVHEATSPGQDQGK